MKASKVAAVVTALLATDAKPTEASILAAIIAADKKGKDEGGLGPVENQDKPKKGEDEFPEKDKAKDKAKDSEKDDEKAKDAEVEEEGMDEEEDDKEKAKDADVQPKESVTGGGKPAGNKGPFPAKDKKATDAAIKIALDARDALHAARRDVETVLGVVAYDSAETVYKAALDKLGVDTAGVHPSAFATLFRMKREAVSATASTMASDAATVRTVASVIKGYDRLQAR